MAKHVNEDFILIATELLEGLVKLEINKHDKHLVWLYDLMVQPEHRRKGIGSALIAEAEREAKLLGITTIALAAKLDEFTVDWYKRLGYAPIVSDECYMTLAKHI